MSSKRSLRVDEKAIADGIPSALPSPGGTLKWYVAATKVSRELYALQHLHNQDFLAFLPLTRVTVRSGKRLVNRRAAFFPGYLFVRLDIGEHGWQAVNSTRGVRRLIMAGEVPLPLPDDFVEGLQAMADGDGLIRPDHDLRVGDRVRIVAGPFAEMIGKLQRLDARGRVGVLIELLNGEVTVSLEKSTLAPAA